MTVGWWSRLWRSHRERIMFLVVGGWNTFLGYGLFAGLYFFLQARTPLAVIIVISYVLATANNYVCYKLFVFRTKGNVLREYAKFTTVYLPVFAANLVVLPIALRALPLNAYAIQALFTVLVVVVSYVGHKYFTFRRTA
jgi:putative flippase GtrA